MLRIYLDWSVISDLKSSSDKGEHYRKLNEFLTKNRVHLLLPYSQYHLNDLKRSVKQDGIFHNDLLKDLNFLKDLSQNNFIKWEFGDELPEIYIGEPEDILKGQVEEKDRALINWYENSLSSSEWMNQIVQLIANYAIQAALTPVEDINEIDPRFKQIEKLISNPHNINCLDDIIEIIQDINSDPANTQNKIYRTNSLKAVQALKMDTNVTAKYWDSPFKYIEGQLNKHISSPKKHTLDDYHKLFQPKGSDQMSSHFYFAYSILDAMGYHRDKVISNMSDDAGHALAASICDFFVVDDKKARLKTKATYEYMGIQTKVYNVEEFIEAVTTKYVPNEMHSSQNLFNSIFNAISKLQSVDKRDSNPKKGTSFVLSEPLLGHFNRLDIYYHDERIQVTFREKKRSKYTRVLFISEIDYYVNKFLTILGVDSRGRKKLSDKEVEFILKDVWDGRYWVFNEGQYSCHLCIINGELCFRFTSRLIE